MKAPYTRIDDRTSLNAIFDEVDWELGSNLAVKKPMANVLTLQSAPPTVEGRSITGTADSPFICAAEFSQSHHWPTAGVWEVLDAETATLWLVDGRTIRDWPWAVYSAVTDTVAETVGLSGDRVSTLLSSTAARLTEKMLDRGPIRQPSDYREHYHRHGYRWTVDRVDRRSLESFIRWNFLNHPQRRDNEAQTLECIITGLRYMATQLRAEADIVEHLDRPSDERPRLSRQPFIRIAYPTDTHRRETNVAVRSHTDLQATKLNPIETDVATAIEGVESAHDLDIVHSPVEVCSQPAEVIDAGKASDIAPVRVGADRWERAHPTELEAHSRTTSDAVRRFIITRLGLDPNESQFERVFIHLVQYLREVGGLQPRAPSCAASQQLRTLTGSTDLPLPLLHWCAVTGLFGIPTFETPDLFTALPYSHTLSAAAERLHRHHSTVRNLCRGCGTYFDVDPESPRWTCERCSPEVSPTLERTELSAFEADQESHCYICLSPVATGQLQRHHIIPRDVFEDDRVRDRPVNTVTVHAAKCPGHPHAISHQTLDADIDRAWNHQLVEHEPARWFNLTHLAWVLHELGDQMAPPTRQRVIELIYRMWTEQFE
ncbi:hypothetical protein EGH21_18930 [Halomicroarcula sp. F13]|uniref:HNH nuclease domain-containing protein n=1 Tax=Haloarcula rubra TaxID=2487747 RepID=A0AAW4PXV2_9EURY|nr:hypothetical protein [Halomicroarcula rubra]MBX0325107.1 hypothetical protein [Halomicroarcula rubra]